MQSEGVGKRRVVFVIFDGFQSLDLAGPYEVFQHASPLSAEYDCQVVSRAPGLVRSSSGLPVQAGHGVGELDPDGIDTLVVAGGPGVDLARADGALVDWIRAAGSASRRVTSVCSGVFLLAAAGLVTGHRVTTHWSRARQLADEHPGLVVDCDPIFIRDGRVWTSAGVCAGLDPALALVEEDLGQPAAHAVAQELVLFLRRPGTQSQFSVPLWSEQPSSDPIKTVVASVHAGPGARHTIDDLARRARLSPRQLQRRFTAEIGVGPRGTWSGCASRRPAGRWPEETTRWTRSPAAAGSAARNRFAGPSTVIWASRHPTTGTGSGS